MNDLERLLSDLETNENLRAWISGSANEAAADVVLSDLGYNVCMEDLRNEAPQLAASLSPSRKA